jgi:probable HAF family extracellular repeat protein
MLGVCAIASIAHAEPTKYEITSIEAVDLKTMGTLHSESVANDINDLGEIVGWSHQPNGRVHGFLWRNDVFEDITALPGGLMAEATGINNLTQVVGYVALEDGNSPSAFYWDGRNDFRYLDDVDPGERRNDGDCATGSRAEAINNSGEIAGSRYSGCDLPVLDVARAARWQSAWAPWEHLLPPDPAPRSNFAYNLNSAGVIVGWNKDGSAGTNAFHWNQGVTDYVPFPAVVAPALIEPSTVKAFGVNDSYQIVGTARHTPVLNSVDLSTRAFYWDGSAAEAELLPTLVDVGDTAAFEINNQGFAVGYSDNHFRWAVIWHRDFGVRTLDMPPGAGGGIMAPGKHCEALAVNNHRLNYNSNTGLVQAVGFCFYDGRRHATLWNISTVEVTTNPWE